MRYFLFALLFLAGCVTKSPGPSGFSQEADLFITLSESNNQKIQGDAFLETKNLQGFTLEQYQARLSKYNLKRAKDYRDALKKVDSQTVFPSERTFVYCAYSKQLGVAFCDDARCATVEKKIAAVEPPDFEKLREGLPLPLCPGEPSKAESIPDAGTKSPGITAKVVTPQITWIDHKAYSVGFNSKYRTAVITKYRLTAEQLKARYIERDIDPFADDLKLEKKLRVPQSEYKLTGYDKGHLAPAEDFTWDEDAFFESFYMSNMAPQLGDLNQHSWRHLEQAARNFACGEKEVTIITGSIFPPNPKKLKKVAEKPESFFKVIVDETSPRKAIGFIYEQEAPKKTKPSERIFTLAQVENLSGLNLSVEIDDHSKLVASKIADLSAWKSEDCPQKEEQVLASELKKKRTRK